MFFYRFCVINFDLVTVGGLPGNSVFNSPFYDNFVTSLWQGDWQELQYLLALLCDNFLTWFRQGD